MRQQGQCLGAEQIEFLDGPFGFDPMIFRHVNFFTKTANPEEIFSP